MFKEALKILIAVILIGLIGGSWLSSYMAHSLDESSLDFANTAVLSIFKHGDTEELRTRAHPSLYTRDREEEIRTFFATHTSLGRIGGFDGCKGKAQMNFLTGEHAYSAQYSCDIPFENGQANVSLQLVSDYPENWRIIGMNVSTKKSPPDPDIACCINLTVKE